MALPIFFHLQLYGNHDTLFAYKCGWPLTREVSAYLAAPWLQVTWTQLFTFIHINIHVLLYIVTMSFLLVWHLLQYKLINTLRPRQNGRHLPDNILQRILNESCVLIKSSVKFLPQDSIITFSALVQIMACRRSGNKPLSEQMMA